MERRISALVDGELDGDEARDVLAALREEGAARELWRAYHLIGDAMRDTQLLSTGFAARLAARLAAEPTALAPAPRQPATLGRGLGWGAAAAGLAAVVLVAWVAFDTQRAVEEPQAVARATPAPVSPPSSRAPARAESARVPPPAAAHDYLLAHQRYSPGISLQGMAPYVRTVSAEAEADRP
jgi:sigma-E factor negative regulatory protein RseA